MPFLARGCKVDMPHMKRLPELTPVVSVRTNNWRPPQADGAARMIAPVGGAVLTTIWHAANSSQNGLHVKSLDVFEVSPVLKGAGIGTGLDYIKSRPAADKAAARDIEAALSEWIGDALERQYGRPVPNPSVGSPIDALMGVNLNAASRYGQQTPRTFA